MPAGRTWHSPRNSGFRRKSALSLAALLPELAMFAKRSIVSRLLQAGMSWPGVWERIDCAKAAPDSAAEPIVAMQNSTRNQSLNAAGRGSFILFGTMRRLSLSAQQTGPIRPSIWVRRMSAIGAKRTCRSRSLMSADRVNRTQHRDMPATSAHGPKQTVRSEAITAGTLPLVAM